MSSQNHARTLEAPGALPHLTCLVPLAKEFYGDNLPFVLKFLGSGALQLIFLFWSAVSMGSHSVCSLVTWWFFLAAVCLIGSCSLLYNAMVWPYRVFHLYILMLGNVWVVSNFILCCKYSCTRFLQCVDTSLGCIPMVYMFNNGRCFEIIFQMIYTSLYSQPYMNVPILFIFNNEVAQAI